MYFLAAKNVDRAVMEDTQAKLSTTGRAPVSALVTFMETSHGASHTLSSAVQQDTQTVLL